MEFEIHSGGMVLEHSRQPRQVLAGRNAHEPFMASATTPMVLPSGGQHGIAKSQLRLGQVAAHEISIFRRKRIALQPFLGKQQARAAVHEEARRSEERRVGEEWRYRGSPYH